MTTLTMKSRQRELEEIVSALKTIEPQKLEIVKATLPAVKQHGETITRRFYQRMFTNHPELKNIFNQTHQITGHQPKALADAVYAAAANIEDMSVIIPALERIGQKHRSLQIQPEHYPIVGENLLGAIKEVLGDAATDEVLNAWADAYDVISDVFIRMENALYETTEVFPGGWGGYRNFVVDRKVPESDVITSFYLKPQDGKPIAHFTPGQYITVKMDIGGEPYTHLRQYSLSDRPGVGYYRISVKREESPAAGVPAGVVSTYLHTHVREGDIIPITAPAGDFYLNMESRSPVVLISGGVGLTPLMSMLNTLVEEQPLRPVYFVQAALNSKVHAFKDHVRNTAKSHANVKSFVIYEKPVEGEQIGVDFDKQGFINLDWMKENLPSTDVDYYFCGPTPFMRAVNSALKQWGIPEGKIHYEFFGAFGNLDASL
ncbi:NO-inducible flavohemoprotein [Alicyclobacillus tolerans]|uniref:NO-inducible flavohemoprotein n=1 Tax=Alicyclobacillus tolerans TaxID=90970 RepID=UPI001F01417F|nr:NO-inducible flavohemoprotein [Alicyclobacillus tolerans]MCF8567524.1 NO-inducible flavohemoprotein [Alicyclobacillus tolerans]